MLRVKRLVAEQALRLVLEKVGHLRLRIRMAGAAFAAVAGDEAAMLARFRVDAEIVDGQQAVVVAGLAAGRALHRLQSVELVGPQKMRGDEHVGAQRISRAHAFALLLAENRLAVTVAREQGGAVGSHVARDVGTHRIHARKLLEAAQHRVIQEGAALHDDLRAHLVRVADFDHLEEGVLHDRNRESGGDVAHRRAFLLSLLHAAVHEDRAAAAQVNRVLGAIGGFSEFGNLEVKAACEALDEAAATRRAGLVEHDVVDHAVAHAQAFHVLAANVQDELHAGNHLLGAAQMRHRFNLAGVDAQRLQQQALAVAGHGRVADVHERRAALALRQLRVHLLQRAFRATKHVAPVVRVEAPQQLAVFANERRLERGGTGVDAQEDVAGIARQVAALHALLVVTCAEFLVFGLVREKRIKALNIVALHVAEVLQTAKHVGKTLGRSLLRACDGAAGCHEQMRVLRQNDVLVIEAERVIEAGPQFG